MRKILIYQDYIHNNGSVFKALMNKIPAIRISYVDANDIKNGILNSDVLALVFPGGGPHYFSDKLNGDGNQAIRNYVSAGGFYIGICAGAYYACSTIKWAMGTDQEEIIMDTLKLFQGNAIGPIVPIDNLEVYKEAMKIQIFTDSNKKENCFYSDGCGFEADAGTDYTTWAKYHKDQSNLPAVITFQYDKGKCLLIGPHLEVDTKVLELKKFSFNSSKNKAIMAMDDISDITMDYFGEILHRFFEL